MSLSHIQYPPHSDRHKLMRPASYNTPISFYVAQKNLLTQLPVQLQRASFFLLLSVTQRDYIMVSHIPDYKPAYARRTTTAIAVTR